MNQQDHLYMKWRTLSLIVRVIKSQLSKVRNQAPGLWVSERYQLADPDDARRLEDIWRLIETAERDGSLAPE